MPKNMSVANVEFKNREHKQRAIASDKNNTRTPPRKQYRTFSQHSRTLNQSYFQHIVLPTE